MKRFLTVAGTDSSGGAGVTADLRTAWAHGCHGVSVVTSVTAQNSLAVTGSWPIPADGVRAQLDAVLDDIGADVVKTGMLVSAPVVRGLVDVLDERLPSGVPVVVDPVLASTSGTALIDEAGLAAVREQLLPRATVVTPNLAEAAALTGVRVRDEADLPRVAAAVLALGPRWVLLKGGHLEGDAVDLLTDGDAVHEFRAARVQPGRARGTGCALASALACRLAFGCDVPTAAALAKSFVRSGIERSYRIGRGEPVLGTSSFLSRTSLTPHDGRR